MLGMACKKKLEKCALNDDLAEVLEALQESDLLVMASPVYFGDVSSQLKACMDRMYPFLKPAYLTNPSPVRLAPSKKLVFALAQGEPDEKSFSDIFSNDDYFMKWYGFKESHLIRACGVREAGEIEARQDFNIGPRHRAEGVLGLVTAKVQPNRLGEAIDIYRDSIVPATQQQKGLKSISPVVDRNTGKAMSTTL